MLITVLLGGLGQGVVAPRMPELLHDSQALARDSGLSAALLYFGIFVTTYFYGRAADRGHVHRLLSGGLVGYAATLAGLAFAPSELAVFALRFAEGVSISAVYVGADFVLGRLSPPEKRAQWLSYYGVALSVGLLLGPLIALAFGLHALLGVACGALVFGLASLSVRVNAVGGAEVPYPLPMAPLAAGAAYGYMEAAVVALFPMLAVSAFHVVPEHGLIVVIVAAATSSLAWGWIADRVGTRNVVRGLLAALVVAPLGLAALAAASQAPDHRIPVSASSLAFAACAFFGAIAGGLYPVGFAWLLEGVPEARYGFASGSFARAYGLGSLAGPLIAGFATSGFGAVGFFEALAFAGLAGFALSL